MPEEEPRPMTIAMCVKFLALGTVAGRMSHGAAWNAADVDRFATAAGQPARINVAAMEVQRVLRILEGEDSPEP